MKCPSCGADIRDPDALFCPRCATSLGSEDGVTTTRIGTLDADAEADADADTRDAVEPTRSLETVDEAGSDPPVAPEPASENAPQDDAVPVTSKGAAAKLPRLDVHGTRARLEASGWLDTAAAAGLGFLVLLAIGALLVVAAKLNFPDLGGGADPLGAFTAVVLAALGVLGIPIVVDGVAVSALPLGALVAAGAGFWWATTAQGRDSESRTLPEAVRRGARLAVPLALLCWFFAIVFRFRGDHPVAADAGVALLAGAFWGAVFGIVAATARIESLRAVGARLLGGVRARSGRTYEGVIAGATMLGITGVLALGAALLWIIVALLRGAPGNHFGAGDALAYLVYLIAFLPNVVLVVITLSFGAPIEVGAKVDLGGRLVGPLRDYSLWGWGQGEPLPILLVLVVIPLVACVWAGVRATRRVEDSGAMLHVLLVASAVFAVTLTVLGAIGRLRLAGISPGSGYAAVAPDPVLTLTLSFLASGVLAALGWKLAESSAVPALREGD